MFGGFVKSVLVFSGFFLVGGMVLFGLLGMFGFVSEFFVFFGLF